jgi:PAS domain-containing protein
MPRNGMRQGGAREAPLLLQPCGLFRTGGPDLTVRTEPDATILAANEPFCALVQRPPGSVIGAKLPDLFAGSDRMAIMQTFTLLEADAPVRPRRQRIAVLGGHADIEWEDRAIVAPCGAVMEVVSRGRQCLAGIGGPDQGNNHITPDKMTRFVQQADDQILFICQVKHGIGIDVLDVTGLFHPHRIAICL